MKRKLKRLLSCVLIAAMCVTMFQTNVAAWSYMVHTNSANLTIMEMMSNGASSGGRGGQTSNLFVYAPYDDHENGEYGYAIPNEFYRAIMEYPEAFRAGSLGPDFYPDMVIGQTYIHPYDSEAEIGSGDWLAVLIESVNRLPQYSEGRLEALSFVLGYVLHYCGDMFGHDWVNTFSGGTFPNLMSVNPFDSTDPELNNVLSHMAVESFLDDIVNEAFYADEGMLTLDAPTRFIADTLLLNGNIRSGVAEIYYNYVYEGSQDSILGGIPIYLDVMVDLRRKIMDVADKFRPNTELITMGISSYADQWALDIDRALYGLVDTFDMIAYRLVTGEKNPAIDEDTLHDWIFEGYPIKELIKDKLNFDEIDSGNGAVSIIMEELSLWLETYGWKALGIPDVFVDGLPEWMDYITFVFTWPMDMVMAAIKTALSAIFVEILYAAMGNEVKLLIGEIKGMKARLEEPYVQLDHDDNPYKPTDNNYADYEAYMETFRKEQQLLKGQTVTSLLTGVDNTTGAVGAGVLDQLLDSEFEAFYNTLTMFKLILMGPENFSDLLSEFGIETQTDYTTSIAELKATRIRLDVKTIDLQYSGTDDNVWAEVYRLDEYGRYSNRPVVTKLLDNSLNNDLECGDLNSFYIDLPYPMALDEIEIKLRQDGTATANGGWACERISVTPMHANIPLTDAVGIGVGGNLYMDDGRIWNLEFQQALQLRMNPTIDKNTPVTHVAVRIKTGSGSYWDGTDADVSLGILTYDDNGNPLFVNEVPLGKYLYDDFEDGDDDTYVVPLSTHDSDAEKSKFPTLKNLVLVLKHSTDYEWVISDLEVTPYYGNLKLTDTIDYGFVKIAGSENKYEILDIYGAIKDGKVSYKTYEPLKLTYKTALNDGLLADMQSLDASEQWKYISVFWDTAEGRQLFFKLFKGFRPELEIEVPSSVAQGSTFNLWVDGTGVWNGVSAERRNKVKDTPDMPAVTGTVMARFYNSETGKLCGTTQSAAINQSGLIKVDSSTLAPGTYDIRIYYKAYSANPMYGDTTVTFEKALLVKRAKDGAVYNSKGEIVEVTIADLELPYHNGPLDKTAWVNSDVVFNKVQYTMFNKELDVFKKGDQIAIGVRVNTKAVGTAFSKDGRAYWESRGIYSDKTLIISPTEAVYIFYYTVDADESQKVREVRIGIDKPVIGNAAGNYASTTGIVYQSDGITVESVAWTPDDTTFRAGTSYKVKMQIMLDSWHVWAEDFTTNGKVYVNGNPAKLTKETTGSGKFSMTKYFVEYTFPEIYYGEDTFLLRAVDGDTEINVYNSGEMATLQVETEMAGGQTPYYKWYRCDENGVPYDRYTLSNGTVCNINGIPSEEMMIPRYYRCDAVIGARTQSVIFKVMLCPMGVEVDNPEETFKIVPVGETEVQLYEADTIFGLKVDVTDNGGVLADYQWYRCDENGNMLSEYPNPLSMGDRLIVEAGIPASEMLMPRYYRADACIGNTVRSVLFSVTLCPMGVEEDEYVFTFTDVSESDWYYDYVRQANQLGLINGKSADSYAPSMNMTYAEAIKLACCLNLLNKGEDPTSLGNGPVVWYSTYMDYALANGIIPSDMSDVADQYVTRAEYVTIFERALPDSSFEKKNTIPIGSIPDVAGPITESEKAIYKFYRAGIVNGTDAYGTFKPNDYVIRAEVAAILVRIVSPEYRVNAPAQLGEK